jgi:hypothetical protein
MRRIPPLVSAAVSESVAGRSLATKEQYQVFGQMYADAIGCNFDRSTNYWFLKSLNLLSSSLTQLFLDCLLSLQVTGRVERPPSLNASDVHYITRPIPPIRGRRGNPRRPSRIWVKSPISSWLE